EKINLIKVDLSFMEFIESTTVGILVNLQKAIKEMDGELVLINANPDVITTLTSCSLDKLFKFEKTDGNIVEEKIGVNVGIELKEEYVDDIVYLKVKGMLCNPHEADKFKNSVQKVMKNKDKLLIDFNDLLFIDSSGMAELINIQRLLKKENKKMAIYGMNDIVLDLIYNIGINFIISVFESEEEALLDEWK
ncbi:MAG: STAS domain-containing protein, partial [Elusimicrobiota bacterium]